MITSQPPHPGEVLRDQFLLVRGIKQKELAAMLGVSRHVVSRLLHGQSPVTAELAIRLALVSPTSPRFWMYLQVSFDLYNAEKK